MKGWLEGRDFTVRSFGFNPPPPPPPALHDLTPSDQAVEFNQRSHNE